MINEVFVAYWVERLRSEIPDARAILLKGSHVRGEAGRHSDVDFDVLILERDDWDDEYRAFIEPDDSGHLVHVSVAVSSVTGWLQAADEAEAWAFGFPAAEATRLLWIVDEALRSRLDRPYRVHPAGGAELEDFVEGFGKVKNARSRNDDLALRLAAQNLARLCPTLLRLINPEVRPGTHLDALRAALDFPIAPPCYREDMLRCLGLDGQATSADDVLQASGRLVTGTIHLLRTAPADHSPEFEIGLAPLLYDGTLERYVRQS